MKESKTVSATEAARRFSDLINSVKYRGEVVMIIRGKKPVATICPIASVAKPKSLKDFRDLLKNLPGLGADADAFARDIDKIRQYQPSLPKKSPWE